MKPFLTFTELQECIRKADENGACSENLSILKDLTSIEEFFDHPNCTFWLYWYAAKVMKNRWLEAEEVIKRDPKWACLYALNVIKGRWTEAEDVIKNDPKWAYDYAKRIIKGRWVEAEDAIFRYTHYTSYY